MCKAFYRADKGDKSLTNYFMDFKRTYEELNMLLPFSTDVTVQQAQREKLVIMSFLAGLPFEFETAKSQILSGSEISSLQDVFSRVFRTENSPIVQPAQANSALVSRHNIFEAGKHAYRIGGVNKGLRSNNYDKNTSTYGQESGGIVCHYCHKPGHIKWDCRRL